MPVIGRWYFSNTCNSCEICNIHLVTNNNSTRKTCSEQKMNKTKKKWPNIKRSSHIWAFLMIYCCCRISCKHFLDNSHQAFWWLKHRDSPWNDFCEWHQSTRCPFLIEIIMFYWMTLYSRGRKVAETSSVVYYIYREGFLFVFDGAWYKYYFLFYYTLLDQSKKKTCYWQDESEYCGII